MDAQAPLGAQPDQAPLGAQPASRRLGLAIRAERLTLVDITTTRRETTVDFTGARLQPPTPLGLARA